MSREAPRQVFELAQAARFLLVGHWRIGDWRGFDVRPSRLPAKTTRNLGIDSPRRRKRYGVHPVRLRSGKLIQFEKRGRPASFAPYPKGAVFVGSSGVAKCQEWRVDQLDELLISIVVTDLKSLHVLARNLETSQSLLVAFGLWLILRPY